MAHDSCEFNRTSRLVCGPLLVVLATSCGPAGARTSETDSALADDGKAGSTDSSNPSKADAGGARGHEAGSDSGGASPGRWPHSGDFAEWYRGKIPDLPYVVGGQVVFEWSELDTTLGYEWSKLDMALSAMTAPTTLQINGSTKPTYVFDKVPYVDTAPCTSWPKDVEVGDIDPVTKCPRVAMYWHPAFQDIYAKFLAALGEHLHSTSSGAKVVALRQNWNAFGTEHLSVPEDFRSASKWIDPPGVSKGSDYTSAVQYAYEGAILSAHISSFFVGSEAEPPVFVRNSLESEVLSEASPSGPTYEALFEAGKLGWFTTGAEMEPRDGGGGGYDVFLTYAASGKTLALAEPWADAWGIHSGIDDHHWASPPQFLYWRLLSDMQLGISYVDCYGDDLDVAENGVYGGQKVTEYQPEFNAAFEFASKYAGYAGRPGMAPGAFIAFRPLDPAVTHYAVADYAEFVSLLNADATTGIDPRDDGSKGVTIAPPYGVTGNKYFSIGPTTQRFGAWARSLAAGASAELALDSKFREHENAQPTKVIHVTYLDDVAGDAFTIAAAGVSLSVKLTGTARWQVATLQSKKAFSPDAAGADIVVTATKGTLTLHMVETTF